MKQVKLMNKNMQCSRAPGRKKPAINHFIIQKAAKMVEFLYKFLIK